MIPLATFGATLALAPDEAEKAPLASQSLLLDIATAGSRLVAVGERGHVLLSDDRGTTWKQADSIPTQALLTAVCFADAQHGIVVGHDQVILITQDGGRTWQRTHYAPEAQQPLLDVWCGQSGQAVAIGAYASYFVSPDGGKTWSERKFAPQPAPDSDYHLNRIVAASATRSYIAGEAGHLYRSDDAGNTWITLQSPYEGSFFGVLPLAGDRVLAYGLRGHLFESDDAGASWRKIETGTVAMLNDGVRFDDGRLAIVGLSGTVLVSRDGGTWTLSQQDDRKGLSAALAEGNSALLAVGEGGVKRIELSPP